MFTLKVKKLLVFLLVCVLLTACGGENEVTITKYSFSSKDSMLFPFFVIDTDGVLWRVANNGATSFEKNVIHKSGIDEKSFVRYVTKTSSIFFATDITVENGVALCTFVMNDEVLGTEVVLDTIRVNKFGQALFILKDGSLIYRSNGILSKLEGNVAEAEFTGEDQFIYRSSEGKFADGEFSYKIYAYSGGYRNYVTDANKIVSADDGTGIALISKKQATVQKRAVSKTVADCYVVYDSELLGCVPQTELSQFDGNTAHTFLLSCNTGESVLKYDLYKISTSGPELIDTNVIFGEYISAKRDAFRYDLERNGEICTNAVFANGEKTELDAENGKLYAVDGTLYYLESNTLTTLDGTIVSTDTHSVIMLENALILVNGATPPYEVSTLENGTVTLLDDSVQSLDFEYENGYFYFNMGESTRYDLALVSDSAKTALVSNIDRKIGFLHCGKYLACAKNDDKSLYIITDNSIIASGLKIKRFITPDEVL